MNGFQITIMCILILAPLVVQSLRAANYSDLSASWHAAYLRARREQEGKEYTAKCNLARLAETEARCERYIKGFHELREQLRAALNECDNLRAARDTAQELQVLANRHLAESISLSASLRKQLEQRK